MKSGILHFLCECQQAQIKNHAFQYAITSRQIERLLAQDLLAVELEQIYASILSPPLVRSY